MDEGGRGGARGGKTIIVMQGHSEKTMDEVGGLGVRRVMTRVHCEGIFREGMGLKGSKRVCNNSVTTAVTFPIFWYF